MSKIEKFAPYFAGGIDIARPEPQKFLRSAQKRVPPSFVQRTTPFNIPAFLSTMYNLRLCVTRLFAGILRTTWLLNVPFPSLNPTPLRKT
jgi:hypothetical protein